jgi:hypothetical protein
LKGFVPPLVVHHVTIFDTSVAITNADVVRLALGPIHGHPDGDTVLTWGA